MRKRKGGRIKEINWRNLYFASSVLLRVSARQTFLALIITHLKS